MTPWADRRKTCQAAKPQAALHGCGRTATALKKPVPSRLCPRKPFLEHRGDNPTLKQASVILFL